MPNIFRSLPTVNELLENPALRRVIDRANHTAVVSRVKDFLDNARQDLLTATAEMRVPTANELAERIADWIANEETPLRPVINATGVLLPAGLGRAPLATEALVALREVGGDYCNVGLNLESGEATQHVAAVDRQLRRLTGAEAALVVNNTTGATILTLAALGGGREVVVSRGELLETCDGYSLVDAIHASGVKLREISASNVTRAEDYQAAIGDETAAVLRISSLDFHVVGYSQRPSLSDLVAAMRGRDVPLIEDLGAGALVDLSKYGISDPTVSASLRAGVDVVLLSGDKLLGGPQCGIILGRRALLQRIGQHPLARALRADKLTLAALAATLALYSDANSLESRLPLFTLLSTPLENLQLRAQRLAPQLAAAPAIATAEALPSTAFLTEGRDPNQQFASWAIALTPARGSVELLHARLRTATPAVCGRTDDTRLLLDLRSVFARHDLDLVHAVQQLGAIEVVENRSPVQAANPSVDFENRTAE